MVSKDDSSSNSMVWKASETSTMVKTFALVRSGSFSSIVGILYLGLRMALFMVWLGSMHIRSFPFGFSLTRKQVCELYDWFYDAPARKSL